MQGQPKFKLTNPTHFLAIGFGSGLIRPAPGTWGTLASIPLYIGLVHLLSPATIGYFIVLSISFLAGIYLCGKTATDVGEHDHSAIVWDEFVGFWVTMALVSPIWLNVFLGFVLFRIFDILKPWPIKLLDQSVKGGFGIMIDDVLAGVLAAILLYLAQPYLLGLI